MRDLSELRVEIDAIDLELMRLFEERMAVVKEIVMYKKVHDMAIFQPDREAIVLEKNIERLTNKELADYAKHWLQSMMDQSKKYQMSILEKMDK